MVLVELGCKAHNKAFKRDSCRVAFLVCGGFCGENGLRKVGLYGIHPLTQRYVPLYFSAKNVRRMYVYRVFDLSGASRESRCFCS
ncbi:DUF3265 domain-containing protein [Vibrio vulnificus]|nr:DUF3265 domain-containing protein [Vibrio vulnificus]